MLRGFANRVQCERNILMLNDRARLAAILVFGASHALAQNPATTVNVDANANQHAINPNIYGIAYGDAHDMTTLNAPLNRWGGDATSRYNWQIDAHSAGNDWYFETYPNGNGTPAPAAPAGRGRACGRGARRRGDSTRSSTRCGGRRGRAGCSCRIRAAR